MDGYLKYQALDYRPELTFLNRLTEKSNMMQCNFIAVFRFFPAPAIRAGISLTGPTIGIGFDKDFNIRSDYRTRRVIFMMLTYSDYRTTINITILYRLLRSVLNADLNVKKRIIDIIKKSSYSSVIFYQTEYDEEIQKINVREKKIGT